VQPVHTPPAAAKVMVRISFMVLSLLVNKIEQAKTVDMGGLEHTLAEHTDRLYADQQ
jgi:hypothetical protein